MLVNLDDDIFDRRLHNEHVSWIRIWDALEMLTGKTREELNRTEWVELKEAIETWHEDRLALEVISKKRMMEAKPTSVGRGVRYNVGGASQD